MEKSSELPKATHVARGACSWPPALGPTRSTTSERDVFWSVCETAKSHGIALSPTRAGLLLDARQVAVAPSGLLRRAVLLDIPMAVRSLLCHLGKVSKGSFWVGTALGAGMRQ